MDQPGPSACASTPFQARRAPCPKMIPYLIDTDNNQSAWMNCLKWQLQARL